MEPASPAPRLRVQLRLFGEPLTVEAPQPSGAVTPDALLPFFRAFADALVERSVARSAAAGNPLSCRRGCDVCCRSQPVPVAPMEAFALAELVEAMPEPRRTEIRARFADRVARLEAAGLAGIWRTGLAESGDAGDADAERFHRLGLACPFLEADGACGIYEHRPLVCRRYVVSSPAENCADPFQRPIEPIPVPMNPLVAGIRAAGRLAGRETPPTLLILALEYAERHRAELSRRYEAEAVFGAWMSELAGGPPPGPTAPVNPPPRP